MEGHPSPSGSNVRKRDESRDLKDAGNRNKPNRSGGDSPELRVVGIDFNPGPDTQDRRRSLFTLLVEYANKDKLPPSETDSPSEDGAEAEA